MAEEKFPRMHKQGSYHRMHMDRYAYICIADPFGLSDHNAPKHRRQEAEQDSYYGQSKIGKVLKDFGSIEYIQYHSAHTGHIPYAVSYEHGCRQHEMWPPAS
jgi:hypothetical protein